MPDGAGMRATKEPREVYLILLGCIVWIAIIIGLHTFRTPIGRPVSPFPIAGAPDGGDTLSGYSGQFASACKGLGIESIARMFGVTPTARDAATAAAASHSPEGPWRDAAYAGCLLGLSSR